MFETLFQFIDGVIGQNIASMVGVFTTAITPLLGACVTLYIVYLAYKALFDPQNLMVEEAFKVIGSLSCVTFVALNTQWYLSNIVPSVLWMGDDVAGLLLGGSTSGGGSSLQAIFDVMVKQTQDINGQVSLSWTDGESIVNAIWSYLLIVLTWLGFVPFLAISTAYLLVAKIMVSFLLIIGPLFIMMAFFPSTRSMFQAWTGQCFNYILLSIMYPLAFTIFLQVLDFTVFSQNLSLGTCLMTVVIFAALIFLAVQIPTFCSTLSGGVGINGLVGGLNAGLGGAASGAANAAKGGEAAYRGGKTAANAIKDFAKGKIKAG